MPPEVLARVFDPFFTTKRALGTGLGLSISRTLISRAGGTIAATSQQGSGSQFVIDLPCVMAG
jgi:signal transduction histidine kinase